MIVSAEMRWFWPGECPDAFGAWFQAGSPPPGLDSREDEYLYERGQTELGIKRRGAKPGIETKGLVAVLPASRDPAPFAGPIEIWCKWPSSTTLRDLPTVKTKKKRRLRKFDMSGAEPVEIPMLEDDAPADHPPFPREGCNVELTRIRARAGRGLVDVWVRGFRRSQFNRTEPARRAFAHGGAQPAANRARRIHELPGLARQARSAPLAHVDGLASAVIAGPVPAIHAAPASQAISMTAATLRASSIRSWLRPAQG